MGTLISILKRFINSDFTKPLNTLIDEVKATLALIKAKTDTITADLFTSTHASRIDANISSRQASWGATTTHSSRIDASISSRASQASVDAITTKLNLNSSFFVPSSNILFERTTEYVSSSSAYVILTSFTVTFDGIVTVSYDYKNTPGGSVGRNKVSLLHNGVIVEEIAPVEDNVYRTASRDLSVKKGDVLAIQASHYTFNSSQYPVYVKNARVKGSPATTYVI